MPVAEEQVSITLTLPRSVVDRVGELAKQKHASLDDQFGLLVANGLQAELSVGERLKRLSDVYRARLDREGRLNQTAEEVMDELRRIREQVADELHPD